MFDSWSGTVVVITNLLQLYSQARNEAPDSVVSKLITRMVKDGDEQSAREAEETIKNVATVTIEGSILQ